MFWYIIYISLMFGYLAHGSIYFAVLYAFGAANYSIEFFKELDDDASRRKPALSFLNRIQEVGMVFEKCSLEQLAFQLGLRRPVALHLHELSPAVRVAH
jgi:hypothetical protein